MPSSKISEKVKRKIPDFLYGVAEKLEKEKHSPEQTDVLFLYKVMKTITTEIQKGFFADVTYKPTFFGFGKFRLKQKVNYKTGQLQLYIKFEPSTIYLTRVRLAHGTATEAAVKQLERSEQYLQNIVTKRLEYQKQKAANKEMKVREKLNSDYITKFSDMLQLSL